MKKYIFSYFLSCTLFFLNGQSFLDYSIVSSSGGNTTILVRAQGVTPFGKGISGGLSLDGGSTYPYGWGAFDYDSDLGGGN
ncbi:MAG: hypothetical protein WAU01_08225, partial [Saprospiraceae bacterium]